MVGIVIVSHSAQLAAGVVDLVKLIAADCPIAAAGGLEDGSFGTSYERILNAIETVHGEDGVRGSPLLRMLHGKALQRGRIPRLLLLRRRICTYGLPVTHRQKHLQCMS